MLIHTPTHCYYLGVISQAFSHFKLPATLGLDLWVIQGSGKERARLRRPVVSGCAGFEMRMLYPAIRTALKLLIFPRITRMFTDKKADSQSEPAFIHPIVI